MMENLERLLIDGNMKATSVYMELEPMLAGMPGGNVAQLDKAINRLDFPAALDELREFMSIQADA